MGPLLQLRGRDGGNRRTPRQNQNLRRMDKLMKAYDYLPEAHEYTKGLNHYQKHALLIQSVSYTHLTLPTNREV